MLTNKTEVNFKINKIAKAKRVKPEDGNIRMTTICISVWIILTRHQQILEFWRN